MVFMPTSILSPSALLAHHERSFPEYARLAQLIAQFLAWRVHDDFKSSRLPVLHMYQHRAKSLSSLAKNIGTRGRYEALSLDVVTDLAGARLIFYFKDDLQQFIARRSGDFEAWFGATSRNVEHIHGSKRPDGSRQPGPGYESHHFLVRVTPDTLFYRALHGSDQSSFGEMFCEIQLRTILKHAWAEAEHDLRYKVENVWGIPLPVDQTTRLVNAAATIDASEDILSAVKNDLRIYLARQVIDPDPKGTVRRRESSPYPRAYSCAGVVHPYELLDESSLRPPVVQERADIFSIDVTMEALLGVKKYKQSMWNKLRREEPAFIATIDHDTLVPRVCGWDALGRILLLQPAYYSDQVVTNHVQVLGKEIPDCKPPRSVVSMSRGPTGDLLGFEASPMSNTLGVSCMIRVEGTEWIISHRSRSVAFDPGLLGCSASGALEWTELGYWEGRDFLSWCVGGIARELEEELGFRAEPSDFQYLGFARELRRAGKPQLFFFLDLPRVSFHTVKLLWTTYTGPAIRETDSRVEFKDIRSVTTPQALVAVSGDENGIASAFGTVGLSEELRMNLALALKHVGII